MNKKVILMILDGWGKSPDPKVSAIDNANTQFIDALYTKYGHAMLRTWKKKLAKEWKHSKLDFHKRPRISHREPSMQKSKRWLTK